MVPGKIPALAVSVLLIQGCASISVSHEFDPDADYPSYRTFDWMPTESRRVDLRARDPMVEQRIRDAIQREMEAKGLRKVDSADPDVRIGYLLVLDEGVDSQTVYERADPDWRYRTYGPTTTTTRSQMLTVGTLVIDVFDSARKESVWRGIAEGQVREEQDPEKRRTRINDAVKKILADYPPGR
ncbi:MAG: DUF4136 domain-containing protein [Longimicrobiales bacterium]